MVITIGLGGIPIPEYLYQPFLDAGAHRNMSTYWACFRPVITCTVLVLYLDLAEDPELQLTCIWRATWLSVVRIRR